MKEKQPLLGIFTFVIYIFLLAPLVIIIGASFGPDNYLAFPPKGFSLKWYENIFHVEMFWTSFKISIAVAMAGIFISFLLGIPAAYALSRFKFKGQAFFSSFFISPIIIPGIVFGYGLLKYLVITYKIPIFPGVLIGHVVIMIPYVIRVISSSLMNFDYSVEEAAMSLGSSRLKTFFNVVLPNIRSGIIAGILLAFLESFNNVDVSVFMTGPGVSTLPISMLNYVEYYFDPTIAAISVLLMIMTAILIGAIERTLGLRFFTK
ncbi:ABC transporter permease [Paenibacillus ginsengarvi]|uniref:ABC transporter permease n=1 Tax=Paenibacillus ginsengarvi TaxID=400777 RepID=A0A3B0BLU5_9BACL|nr:ABC transporter permease [Paenibacillus ginsengarvi]RKN74152.1 ABC transporter permease [Paenibacillus ginsengarvi]